MLVWTIAANLYRSFYEKLGGQQVGEKEANIGGTKLKEISYGWQDLSAFGNILKRDTR
jgi:hypothetical protein